MKIVNIGVIGYGYWGPNIVRNFYTIPSCKVCFICDAKTERLSILNTQFPNIRLTNNADEIINDPDIDAIVITTPTVSHFELAKKSLEKGKHVLVEKPLTNSVKEAEILIELATRKKLVLMTDHTFLYTGAIKKMKELLDSKFIGSPQYFDSTRINLGLFQPDINVLWDLAPHDLSILIYLIDEMPYSVNATGISHTKNKIENIAYMTINYQTEFIAHLNCSWSSPVKVRSTLIGGDKKMILYNDLEPSEKIKIYDTGFSLKTEEDKTRIMVDYRTGDVYLPKLISKEALSEMAEDFIHSIIENSTPISNSELSLNVVKILEASEKSIKNNGQEIKI